jgi:hypothetical protein
LLLCLIYAIRGKKGLGGKTTITLNLTNPIDGIERVTLEMFGQVPASPLFDEVRPQSSIQPELSSQSPPDPANLSDALDASSDMLTDLGSKRLLPALVARTSTPRRAARVLPVGTLLYLLSVGIVAAATVGVLFGIGFFLLAQPNEAAITNISTEDHASDTVFRRPDASSNASSVDGDIASVPIEPQVPRSAATAALPVVTVALPPERPSSAGDLIASDENNQSFGKGAPGFEVRLASPDPPSPAALTAEPGPGSSAPAPTPERVPRLSAGQIAELLARGDLFLHAGDVTSARLFYERAADAGDWQAAIRMGATFDPAFLGRAGVRTVGEPTKAQSWYRHALDLGAPGADPAVDSPNAK